MALSWCCVHFSQTSSFRPRHDLPGKQRLLRNPASNGRVGTRRKQCPRRGSHFWQLRPEWVTRKAAADKKAGGNDPPAHNPFSFRSLRLRLLHRLLRRTLGGRRLFGLTFTPANQRQGIGGVERELTHRGLGRAARIQRHVHTAITRHADDLNSCQRSPLLFRRQFCVLNDGLFHLVGSEIAFGAKRLGVNRRLRNTLLDQEVLYAGNTALRESLVEGSASAMVGVTFQRQMRVGLDFTVLLEVRRKNVQRLLLARQQPARRIFRGRLSRREVNAVQRQPGFECFVDRRRRILNRNLRRSLRVQSTRVRAVGRNRDRTWWDSRGIEGCRIPTAGKRPESGSPVGNCYRYTVGTGAIGGNVHRSARRQFRRIRGEAHCRRILRGKRFDGVVCRTTSLGPLLSPGIGYVRRDRISAGRDIVGIDTGRRILSGYLAAIAAPAISHGVLGIEIARRRGGCNRFANHDLGWLDRAGSDGGGALSSTQSENDTCPQSHTLHRRTS